MNNHPPRITISAQEVRELMSQTKWARSILHSQEFRSIGRDFSIIDALFITAYICLGDYLYGFPTTQKYWQDERLENFPLGGNPRLEYMDTYWSCYVLREMQWNPQNYQPETIDLVIQIENLATALESKIR